MLQIQPSVLLFLAVFAQIIEKGGEGVKAGPIDCFREKVLIFIKILRRKP